MNNPIRVRYFLWLAALLVAFFAINSLSLLLINLPEIRARGPDWREEFQEWLVITSVGLVVLPFLLVAAWRISRHMLSPLRAIVQTANRIYDGRFEERVQVANTHDEIAEVAAGINRALDRYDEAMARQREIAAVASHQLRTPLANIRSIGEVALHVERDGAEYRETIGTMLEEANRLTHVVEQLLMMGRLSGEQLRRTFAEFDVAELLEEVRAPYEPLVMEKRIETRYLPPAGLRWRGQRALLGQALTNLYDNAIRHSPEGGCLAWSIDASSTQLEVTISDQGPGVAGLSPSARTHHDATVGLGLKIAEQIALLHRGQLLLENLPAGGARASLRLPKG
jgi:signal transduction histidine kinase